MGNAGFGPKTINGCSVGLGLGLFFEVTAENDRGSHFSLTIRRLGVTVAADGKHQLKQANLQGWHPHEFAVSASLGCMASGCSLACFVPCEQLTVSVIIARGGAD
jgi:hypothetical protein